MINTSIEPGAREDAPLRQQRTVVGRNIGWNWAGTAVEMACGLVVAPFLVAHLGNTGYGLWIVIGSLAGYFSLLDFGVSSAIGRHLAFHKARRDNPAIAGTLTSALAIMSVAGLTALGAVVAFSFVFLRWFDVPVALQTDASRALLIIGVNLALRFPAQVFDGTLWAYQRFDLLNYVDIPHAIARTALTLILIGHHGGLESLAAMTLALTIAAGVAKAVLSFREDPALRVRLTALRREYVQPLFGFGWWAFLMSIGKLTSAQMMPLIVGTQLGVGLVTPFSVARRLQDYANRVLWTATGVMTPVATRMFAEGDRRSQERLFVEGGRWCLAVALLLLTLFVVLGHALIAAWMGPALAHAATLLVVLATGDILTMSQSITGTIVLGAARHRVLALVALSEAAAMLVLAFLLAPHLGLSGVCLALAAPRLLITGIGTLLQGCRVVGMAVGTYLRRLLWPLVPAVLPVVTLFGVIAHVRPAHGFADVIVYGSMFSAAFAASCVAALLPGAVRRVVSSRLAVARSAAATTR